jgi:hypothetical protein
VQVLTRGSSVKVPEESLVTFRLQQPLRTGVADRGFSRNGWHYHPGYGTEPGNTAPYEAGLQAGRADRQRNRTFNSRSTSYRGADLSDYQDGYERGYEESLRRTPQTDVDLFVGAITTLPGRAPRVHRFSYPWTTRRNACSLAGRSGTQAAPWIMSGHKYLFTLEDSRGRELARDVRDLRQPRRR